MVDNKQNMMLCLAEAKFTRQSYYLNQDQPVIKIFEKMFNKFKEKYSNVIEGPRGGYHIQILKNENISVDDRKKIIQALETVKIPIEREKFAYNGRALVYSLDSSEVKKHFINTVSSECRNKVVKEMHLTIVFGITGILSKEESMKIVFSELDVIEQN